MLRIVIRSTITLAVIGWTAIAIARSSGPPAASTGAPAIGSIPAESSCTQCHYGAPINSSFGKLEILDLPATYESGVSYPIRVRLRNQYPQSPWEPLAWGFQLTAVRADDGRGAGSFTVPPTLQVLSGSSAFASRRYVEHSASAIKLGELGPVEWAFTWTAPQTPVGTILFFACGNGANGDGSYGGDRIYTASDSVRQGGLLAAFVPPSGDRAQIELPRPHPVRRRGQLGFSISRPGMTDFSVFDMQGRRLKSLFRGNHPAGRGVFIWAGDREDGSPVPSGVYQLRLTAPGETAPVVQKLILTR